jgi:hypothetical protein
MRHRYFLAVAGFFAAAAILPLAAERTAARQGQASNQNGVQVRMTVSVEARHGTEIPPITREDVVVEEGREHDKVTGWIPAQGPNAGLDLLVLLDDSSSSSLGSQLEDIRAFVAQQPPTTFIGVGYAQNGTVRMVQNFTQDHASAAKALRLPLGAGAGVDASPYFSVSDYVKHWPANPARPRREILLISSGADTYYGGGPEDPYVDNAVEDAQRAGVTIYSIYAPGSGHAGHSFYRMNWGQNYLSELSDKTGGESYYLGLGAAVSFTPYLDELTHQLQHQYLLTFLPKPEKKAGMQRVRLATEVSGAELVYAESVYVTATPD